MSEKTSFELAVEEATGMDINFIYEASVDEMRQAIEQRHGRKKMHISGNNYISNKEVEADMDRIFQHTTNQVKNSLKMLNIFKIWSIF